MSLPRPTKIKNKTPAPIQVTAEQILREARECREPDFHPPAQKITDPTELADYRLRKRRQFEDRIRRAPSNKAAWVNYAAWENTQNNFDRARSVWERALTQHGRDHSIWLKYAESEMKNKFVNHARNVWDRAVTILPRVDQLWLKYIHLEENLGNVAGARQLFERWMSWLPDLQGWKFYIKFELRYKEVDRARAIYERLVEFHPKPSAWIRFAKFEVNNDEINRARNCYERAVESVHEEDEEMQELLAAYAEFEEKYGEVATARSIYKYALDRAPEGKVDSLCEKSIAFEKRRGDKEGIEDAIVVKRRFEYEEEVKRNPRNYDAWFDYIRLEESSGVREKIRDVYERAIGSVPPSDRGKRYWKRYIYVWINYALFEELEAEDVERTRQVYKRCLNLIPHKKFSFAKIWLLAAKFELRQRNLQGARLLLGSAIGKAPKKDKIFHEYIEMELEMKEIDRARTLYEKYLECSPESCYPYIKYAELETCLGETERARAIFELGFNHPLEMPELLWKAYVDFELSNGEFGRARELYKRLLDRTKHLSVWVSYAKFEATAAAADDEHKERCLELARRVFEDAVGYFKGFGSSEMKMREERAMLLEEWLEIERSFGELGDVDRVRAHLPKKLKKRRWVETEDSYEECFDYVYPEEIATTGNCKILEAAFKWKRQKLEHGEGI